MTIQNVPPDAVGQRPALAAPAPRQPVADTARPRRSEDQIELSDEARARAVDAPADNASSLTPARVASLKAFIASGEYKDAQVRDQVARRLLSLGEV
jgi:anti-sigma28 factor (negative regulator of flagellin synthesis)